MQFEDFLVRKLERIRRVVILVVLGALFVLRLEALWPAVVVVRCWMRRLGSSSAGVPLARGGPYLLLPARSALLLSRVLALSASH